MSPSSKEKRLIILFLLGLASSWLVFFLLPVSRLYTFEWTMRRWYLILVPSCLCMIFARPIAACFVAWGFVAGQCAGEFIGEPLYRQQLERLAAGEDIHPMHQGVLIWLCVWLGLGIAGLILEGVLRVWRRRREG